MDDVARLELVSEQLAGLPIINVFYDRLDVAGVLARFVPVDDARLKLSPAAALGVVVRNLVIHHEPVYALGEWAAPFDAGLLGLATEQVELLNDDRVGRMLARLFDADRASLLTRLVLDAVATFDIDLSRLHNDSTSISFAGVHAAVDGHTRGGKPTPAIVHGHNKDGRPDLKQLVWILTVTADGAVPITYRAVDGNTNDDTTHEAIWDELVALTGRSNFMYVADSKLASRANMDHIARGHGRFLAVLPASRAEDRAFRDWIVDHEPDWTFAMRRASRHPGAPDDIWHTTDAPWPSSEGYRITWVRSTAKIDRDATTRHNRIAKGIAALDELNQRLASPRRRIRTLVAVEQAATTVLADANATRWVRLEKRHAQLKGTQLVAPMWLRDPARIEGLLTCHFIAMLISSLIERTIRQAMTDIGLDELSLYPEDRGCTAPTTARILEIFTGVARHQLTAPDGTVLRTFHPELTELQRQVLNLLDIPTGLYNPAT